MKNRKLLAKRIFAYLIDWVLINGIATALFFTGPRFDLNYLVYPSVKMFSAYGVYLGILCFFALPLIKDLAGKSLGKLIFGLVIKDKKTGGKPRFESLVFRNLLFQLPLVELIALLALGGETLGDKISNTAVSEK